MELSPYLDLYTLQLRQLARNILCFVTVHKNVDFTVGLSSPGMAAVSGHMATMGRYTSVPMIWATSELH